MEVNEKREKSEDIIPRVFISYSQDSYEFADKVLDFANKLRQDGIDAIIDQYEEAPAEGWPKWMERNIDEADYVLVVSSKGYDEKNSGKYESGKGLGVKWEGNIIYQKLYSLDAINEKFIPVVFKGSDKQYILTPLQPYTYYNVSEKKWYDKLYWRMRGVTTTTKPPLGQLKSLPEKERKTLFFSSVIDIKAWDDAVWRGTGFAVKDGGDPVMMLLFKNRKGAELIFKGWKQIVGEFDDQEQLRIALVEGEVEGEPEGYYVSVGDYIDKLFTRVESYGLDIEETEIVNISRIIRSTPTDNFFGFNVFKEVYTAKGEYLLVPAIVDEKKHLIKPMFDLGIRKKDLIYRNICDIGENDPDCVILKKNKPWKNYSA